MITSLHPAPVLLGAALLLPLLRSRPRGACLLLAPLAALADTILCCMNGGIMLDVSLKDAQIVPIQLNTPALALCPALALLALLTTLANLHVRENDRHMASLVYVASALGVLCSQSWLRFLVFWELMTLMPVVLVWLDGHAGGRAAGYRFLCLQAVGILLLVSGLALLLQSGGDPAFGSLAAAPPAAQWLMLSGFLMSAAVLPFHAWLPDLCSQTSPDGALLPGVVTITSATYALAQTCAGHEALPVLGLATTLYGLVRAAMADELRRLAAWATLAQNGLVVAALGLGTPDALAGAMLLSVGLVLSAALMFMGVGAVVLGTGRGHLHELGRLGSRMPITCGLMLAACLSFAAMPGFADYAGQTAIIAAFHARHEAAGWLLHFMAACTLPACSLRIFWHLFCATCPKAAAIKASDPPGHLLVAACLAALLSLLLGMVTGLYPMAGMTGMMHTQEAPFSAWPLLRAVERLCLGVLLFILCQALFRSGKARSAPAFFRPHVLELHREAQHPARSSAAWRRSAAALAARSLKHVLRFPEFCDRCLDMLMERCAVPVLGLGRALDCLPGSRVRYLLLHMLAAVALLIGLGLYAFYG